MRLESSKLLSDMKGAAERVVRFTPQRSRADYQGDEFLRSAVERQFEIIGEALGKLVRTDAPTAARITEYRRIITFRNVLIHGYDSLSNDVVWDIVEMKLPVLMAELDQLLSQPDDTSPPPAP